MIFVLDNYDSFTYNLVQYMGELGAELRVERHDRKTLDILREGSFEKIVISPGPCTPDDAGISLEVVAEFAGKVPLLGVCLGHQCIGQAFGGVVERAAQLMHGKTSMIHHNGETIFAGVENPFEATRYHSLIVRRDSVPDCLEVTAWIDDGTVMGLRHKEMPVWGVQFHPESILTGEGKHILKNFLEL